MINSRVINSRVINSYFDKLSGDKLEGDKLCIRAKVYTAGTGLKSEGYGVYDYVFSWEPAL